RFAESLEHGVEAREGLFGVRCGEVVEHGSDWLARLAGRNRRAEIEQRVRVHEAQKLPSHIARSAQHDDGNPLAHPDTFAVACVAGPRPRPMAVCNRSPSAAPWVSAFSAGTPDRCLMM